MKEKYCIFYESQHDGRRSLAERECSMFRERERKRRVKRTWKKRKKRGEEWRGKGC